MKFSESNTYRNLCSTFASECQCGAKYQFIAKEALKQQLTALQMTLKQLAKEEMAHAERFFNLLNAHGEGEKNVKGMPILQDVSTPATYSFKKGATIVDMLLETEKVELHQRDVVYKEFQKMAKQEGYDDVAEAYELIAKIEGDHGMLAREIAEQLKSGMLYKTQTKAFWKCGECGYEIEATNAPATCPGCKLPQGAFFIKTTIHRYFMRPGKGA